MTKQITMAVTDQQVEASETSRPDFFMYTGALKAHEDAEGGERPTVLATASSDAVDLESDRFTPKALKQMKDGFVGKLIFLNHSYEVPMDVFGLVTKADLVKREGRLDLDLVIGVEMNNPMAVQTYQYIVNGTVLGVSVGVIVTDAEKSDEEDEHGRNIFDINGVIPLEASIVGIPANQMAWTRQAIKSLYRRGAIDLDQKDIEARPWLQTVAQIKEAKEGRKDEDRLPKMNQDMRLWATTADGVIVVEITDEEQKETIMAETKDEGDKSNEEKRKDADGTEKDKQGKAEGGADTKDEGDADTKDAQCSTCELPMEPKDDAPEPLVCQNCLDDANTKDEGDKEKDKDADGSGDKKDFDDDVAADEAADILISKMFTGLYVALDNLIPILMDTDLNAGERAKQGDVVIEDWAKFVTETWTEITDGLGDKNAEPDKDFDLTARMHTYIANKDETSCDQRGIEAVTKKVKGIVVEAEVMSEANKQLTETVERQKEALKLMEGVIETMMQLPLQPVTTGKQGVAQRLAEVNPTMDTRVVERMARFASPNHQEKE